MQIQIRQGVGNVMADEEQREKPKNVADFIGGLLSRFANLYAGQQISNLLSMAAFIEGAIVRIIATYLAADKERASYLADKIIDKMSFDRKLSTLKDVLKQNSWEAEFPELIPQLRELFILRNELAHSFVDDDVREEGDDIVFTRYSWRDGDYKQVSVSLPAITETAERAQAAILEDLMTIIGRIEPGHRHG